MSRRSTWPGELLGVDRNAMTGYSFTDFVVEEDRKTFLKHLRRCVRQRCEATSELRLVGAGGQTITTQFRSIPIVGPHEETLCKTAITDITYAPEDGRDAALHAVCGRSCRRRDFLGRAGCPHRVCQRLRLPAVGIHWG